jgi:hypothetical protein
MQLSESIDHPLKVVRLSISESAARANHRLTSETPWTNEDKGGQARLFLLNFLLTSYVRDAEFSLATERIARIMDCGARFAGRRKAGGGYAYYDLLQNRSFDIAGPNPTADERTRVYSEYIHFLELHRREAALAEVRQLAAEEPQVETRIDLRSPTTKPSKFKPCMIKGSLPCTWVKLTSAARNAFASNSKAQALANSR